MRLLSPAFNYGESIPQTYTCDGQNINPPLSFADIPTKAKSLALIVDDPDAPGGTWVHWVVYNISSKTLEIAENSVPPAAIVATTSFGKSGYGGPCPPNGEHQYFFKLFVLDTVLNSSINNAADLEKAMDGHILEKAELMGVYDRKR